MASGPSGRRADAWRRGARSRSLRAVLPDSLLANLLIFAIGLWAAVHLLRTGMPARGGILLCWVLVTADVALVARLVFEARDGWFLAGLLAMQAGSLAGGGWLAWALWRRRWSRAVALRPARLQAAMRSYLQADFAAAHAAYRQLLAVDPWDVAAAVGRANATWRLGRTRQAVRALHRARRLDRRGAYADFIAEQLRRLRSAPGS